MAGFVSWIATVFGAKKPAPAGHNSTLLNPAVATVAERSTRNEALTKLENHLFCWLLDAKPTDFKNPPEDANAILVEIDRRISKGELEELPRQPMTLPMLMRSLSDSSSTRNELSAIILQDPAITDQLLQIANSPFFKPGDQAIESVDQAVFLLGVDGIRSVVAASIMRPMMAARSNLEALFVQRVWRWGMTCARSAELIARIQGQDPNAHFMVGLLPALAYISLFREIQRLCRRNQTGVPAKPALVRTVLRRYDWTVSQILADDWDLPPSYIACLLAAERPVPGKQQTPLNDGIILGTREVLRHAHQRNMGEQVLAQTLSLPEEQFAGVRDAVVAILRDKP